MATGRDPALDAIRGFAVCLAVANHLPTPSLLHWMSVERIGPVSGAELLVIVSGIVLGAVHRGRIERTGWRASAASLWRRSLQLYRVTIGVVLALWLLTAFGLDPKVLTTWTDDATGMVYQMVPAPSVAAVWNLVRLRITPAQCNVLGLYVAFTALAPLALWLLARRRWPLLLAASWVAYTTNAWLHLRVTGAGFESAFPLLTWQLPFVHALVVGYYRRELTAAPGDRRWRWLVGGAAVLAGAFALFASNNPSVSYYPWSRIPTWARLSFIPPDQFRWVYGTVIRQRTWLGLGRLVDAALVVFVLHAALTRWWALAGRAVGWFLVPIGEASLYVFVAHLGAVAVIDRLPLPPGDTPGVLVLNTVVHLAAFLLLWLFVHAMRVLRAPHAPGRAAGLAPPQLVTARPHGT